MMDKESNTKRERQPGSKIRPMVTQNAHKSFIYRKQTQPGFLWEHHSLPYIGNRVTSSAAMLLKIKSCTYILYLHC